MRVAVAGLGVPAAIAESVKLLRVAERQTSLFGHPGAQADLKRAVGQGIEGTRGQGRVLARTNDENHRPVIRCCDDGGGQADLDRKRWVGRRVHDKFESRALDGSTNSHPRPDSRFHCLPTI